MDLSMFLVFPGILITIGIGLLLLSIIIVIIAYKTAEEPVPSDLSKIDYVKNLENENSDDFYNEVKTGENIIDNPDNILEENKNDNLTSNYAEEKESSKIEDNNIENNLEETKVFKFPDESKTKNDEEFIKVESPKKEEISEENEEKIDVFEKEFESFEEPFSSKPKLEDFEHENLLITQTNKKEKEEEEEIEIL